MTTCPKRKQTTTLRHSVFKRWTVEGCDNNHGTLCRAAAQDAHSPFTGPIACLPVPVNVPEAELIPTNKKDNGGVK